MPLISVLTPVKDPVPEHLEQAIGSVREQGYGRWEHVLVDDGSRDAGVRALLARVRRDERRAVIGNDGRPGISGSTQRALERARGSHVVLLDHDDRLHPDALGAVARAFWRGASYVYSDHDLIDPEGRHVAPQVKPGWSPELLLATMYPGHLQGFERRRLLEIGGFRSAFDGSQDYDVALRYTEGLAAIEHLPRVLHHWRQAPGSAAANPGSKAWAQERAMAALREALERRRRTGRVTGGLLPFTYRFSGTLDGYPTVSAILDVTEASDPWDVARAVRALVSSRPAPIEILIAGGTGGELSRIGSAGLPVVANRTGDALSAIGRAAGGASVTGRLAAGPVRLVAPDDALVTAECESPALVPIPSGAGESISCALDRAARRARGDVLLFVRGKVDLAQPGWLAPLLEQVVRPEVGQVGPRLTYPAGVVEHSGLVADEHGRVRRCRWGGRAQPVANSLHAHCVREVTTVPSVGMLMRREVFEQVGGFGEGSLRGEWLDVDLSFRVRWSGLLALYEPHGTLHWCEPDPLPAATRELQERVLAERWGVELVSDPHHAPSLRSSWLEGSS